jgi:signal transduction histidine kinase
VRVFDWMRAWFRPPRQLIAIFGLVTVVPSLLLVAFGWRLLQQDISLERGRREARRAEAADLLVTGLEQAIASSERVLRDREAMRMAAVTPDSVTLAIVDDELEVLPHGRLLYYATASVGDAAPASSFAEGEALEYAQNDPVRAAAWFQRLAAAGSAPVRAGALVRAARNLRTAGRPAAALAAYADAAKLATTAIDEVPTELFARSARCSLLADLKRTSELRREALDVRDLLLEGRWRITRPVFEVYLQSASEWAGAGEPPAEYLLALSAAVEAVWSSRPAPAASSDEWAGRRSTVSARNVQFTVLTQQRGERTHMLIAGPGYVRDQWKAAIATLESRHQVRSALQSAGQRGSGELTRRDPSETGLPWALVVSDATSADVPGRSGRFMWLAVAGILACLVLTGSYVVGRAVSRELAVARLQSDFVSAVSHEFRTPLTSLRQLSEMLLDRADAPADRRRAYYEALQRQTERLHRLVEGLLDFGRMEAGTTPYRLEPIEAGAFVRMITEQFAADPAARNHHLQVNASTPAWIAADADALTNVLWNLLDNAAKYSPGDPRIDVHVGVDRSDVVISVSDRGFGIPPDEQRDVFRKFVRGSRAKAEGISGTGLGLAMVRHVVKAHGGSIDIASALGQGTKVMVRMPMSTPAPSPEVAPCLES